MMKRNVTKKKLVKRNSKPNDQGLTKLRPVSKKFEEEISSDSDASSNGKHEESSESEEETPQEKRLKLAKKYLSQIREEEEEQESTKEIDHVISNRLRNDVLEKAGNLQKKVAASYEASSVGESRSLKNGHRLSITCLALSGDEKYLYSASKDGSVVQWNFPEGRKIVKVKGNKFETEESEKKTPGHLSQVFCMALSSDNQFLATGDAKNNILIWQAEQMVLLKPFSGHRGAVMALSFRQGTHQLFSGSKDRSIKIWNLDEMAYVETLFGHQDSVMALDSLLRDRAVSCGGRDNTVRVWKVPEESQLIFQGNDCSIDVVKMINDQHFVSGGDDGALCLWGVHKKKPLATVKEAHGRRSDGEVYWITALAALSNTDLVASGSFNGEIFLWHCGDEFKSLTKLFGIETIGFVNDLQFSKSGINLVAAVTQEHKLGRWWTVKQARNIVKVMPLKV